MRKFNVTGLCIPTEDYMANISSKIEKIVELIENRHYFTINRARQYGKTTTLASLERTLKDEYTVISISFEGLGDESFDNPAAFCQMLIRQIVKALEYTSVLDDYRNKWHNDTITGFEMLSEHITKMCKDRKLILMIDEVDKTSNNRVFLHFLGMLRDKYLLRKNNRDHTFHSVILAGVYDIKNIKLKMINEGTYNSHEDEGNLYNSPWNIAADFDVDMSFCPSEIHSMLSEYEADKCTGMDLMEISEEIHGYTSGYPFLVSRICKHIDEKLDMDWSIDGVKNAVKIILDERNTLFDDIYKNLENNKKLYDLMYNLVILGNEYTYNLGNPEIALGTMYGLLTKNEKGVAVSNKIFEILLSNYFISKNELTERRSMITGVLREDVIDSERFNMELCIEKFAKHYSEIYSEGNLKFLEKHGRLLFLSYLKPLINGKGFYHIESETRNQRRMDLVVDYGKDEFIIELKLWRGEAYKAAAYKQLLEYMKFKNTTTGYLLTFDFRKEKSDKYVSGWVRMEDKLIFDVVV